MSCTQLFAYKTRAWFQRCECVHNHLSECWLPRVNDLAVVEKLNRQMSMTNGKKKRVEERMSCSCTVVVVVSCVCPKRNVNELYIDTHVLIALYVH